MPDKVEYSKRVVNRSELRRHIDRASTNDEKMRMGDKFAQAVEVKMGKVISDALENARKENRTTLLPRDVED